MVVRLNCPPAIPHCVADGNCPAITETILGPTRTSIDSGDVTKRRWGTLRVCCERAVYRTDPIRQGVCAQLYRERTPSKALKSTMIRLTTATHRTDHDLDHLLIIDYLYPTRCTADVDQVKPLRIFYETHFPFPHHLVQADLNSFLLAAIHPSTTIASTPLSFRLPPHSS